MSAKFLNLVYFDFLLCENHQAFKMDPPNPVMNEEEQRAHDTEVMFNNADRILKSMQTPQTIKDLPSFNGNPIKLHAFIRSVENLIPFISTMENTPFYDIWIQSIRTKITGEADQILEIYGTPLNWDEIKANLIAYYSDKRDPVTLTREMFQLQQTGTIEDFYGKVQNILSHLINHANIENKETHIKNDRINNYKENALQVFLAGIKEPIGSNVRARQPKTLKEAFDASIEEQNFQLKTGLKSIFPSFHSKFQNAGIPMQYPRNFYNNFNIPRLPVPNRNVFAPKPYTVSQPKQLPMEVDRSIRSKQIDYINRPNTNSPNQRYPPYQQQNVNFRQPYPAYPQQNVNFRPPYPLPYPQQNHGNFFQKSGPPRVHIEELHHTEDPYENQIYDPYTYYNSYYPDPYQYNDDNTNYEDDEKTNQLTVEPPQQNSQEEKSDSADNLNFQMVFIQNAIT